MRNLMLSTPTGFFAHSLWERKLFLFGMALMLLARGFALFSTSFNIDDPYFWSQGFNFFSNQNYAVREGRFIFPFLAQGLTWLGFNAALAPTLCSVVSMIVMTVSCILVCRLWGINDERETSLIAVGLMVLHPYVTDFFNWKIALVFGAFPFLICLIAMLAVHHDRKWLPLGVLGFVVALGIHQIPLQYAATTLLLAIPFSLGRNMRWLPWMRMVLLMIISLAIYWIVAKLYIYHGTRSLGIITNGRDEIILFSHPRLVAVRFIELLKMMVFAEPLIGKIPRILMAVLSVMAALALVASTTDPKRRFSFFILIAVVGAATFTSVALTLISASWIPVYRNMVSISLVWAAIGALAWRHSGLRGRKVTLIIACVIGIGFLGASNQILFNQARVNSRDSEMMNRIISDIDAASYGYQVEALSFVGSNSTSLNSIQFGNDMSRGFGRNYGVVHSMFATPYNNFPVFLYREITGTSLRAINGKEFLKSCGNLQWPAPGSVFISRYEQRETAVICLGGHLKVNPHPLERPGYSLTPR